LYSVKRKKNIEEKQFKCKWQKNGVRKRGYKSLRKCFLTEYLKEAREAERRMLCWRLRQNFRSLEKNALLAVISGEKRKSRERCETRSHASILIGRNKIGFEATRQQRGVKFVHEKRSV
jgi:hypothetical protein